MKYLAQIVLVLFVAFLSTPTIVSIIEKKTDVSIFYSLTEEEIHKELKEVKAEIKSYDYPITTIALKKSALLGCMILSNNSGDILPLLNKAFTFSCV